MKQSESEEEHRCVIQCEKTKERKIKCDVDVAPGPVMLQCEPETARPRPSKNRTCGVVALLM